MPSALAAELKEPVRCTACTWRRPSRLRCSAILGRYRSFGPGGVVAHVLSATSAGGSSAGPLRSEEHTSELQSRGHLVCRLLLEKKKSARTGGGRTRWIDSRDKCTR